MESSSDGKSEQAGLTPQMNHIITIITTALDLSTARVRLSDGQHLLKAQR